MCGLVACAMMIVTSAAVGGGPLERNVPLRGQTAEYKAKYAELMREVEAKEAYANASPQERRIHDLKLSIEQSGREAAYYFSQANMYGRIAADSRARAEEIRINQVLNQPYSIRVQSMGYGTYRITPLR
tara:strand:+ start:1917 stop:2303 length:387 start_codon:yes stop_codon:yes gene_type:complete